MTPIFGGIEHTNEATHGPRQGGVMKKLLQVLFAIAFLAGSAGADEVLDWNAAMLRAGLVAGTNPLVMTRVAAIVQSSVFDAVNGIDQVYTPIHVSPAAPAGASRRAAAVQAAYAALVQLYPAQKLTFDARRTASLAIVSDREGAGAVADGIAWGQTVADGILTWRSTDGFSAVLPPYTGGTDPGVWRPTPPAFAPGAGPQFATMTPWLMASPSQFRPAGPPALTSAQYAQDFDETRTMGSLSSPLRTTDQTIYSYFWATSTATYLWNRVAVSLIERTTRGHDRRPHGLLENARLLALLDLAMADAAIACWDAKYTFVFWRPVTAIPLAATDGNDATTADPTWTPLFATPNHPEYPSGHSTVSGAAAAVLAGRFGEHARFQMRSDVLLGVVRSFAGFSAALDEVKNARIYAGIHFRSACNDGQAVGAAVAGYDIEHGLQPVH
jgi:membrane-associated phospholipid phosphatase